MAAASEVVLRCQVAHGSESDFDCWVSALASRAINAPGFVGAVIDSDTVEDRGHEWALTYRFSTREEREAWLSSKAYRAALADSPELFAIPPVEERVDPGEHPTATEAVVSQWFQYAGS
ncbi:MAG: hypothetical protein KDA37_09170 [Planctomycetales bacterium]|nr:hypothetical protein [Planctomycetales bacterium]